MKKYNALLDEMKKSRPVFGFLMGKLVDSMVKTAGTDDPLQEKAHPGVGALAPLDLDEAGVDDLYNAAARPGVSQ